MSCVSTMLERHFAELHLGHPLKVYTPVVFAHMEKLLHLDLTDTRLLLKPVQYRPNLVRDNDREHGTATGTLFS